MLLGEIFGYIASILVFSTFYMKTMVPLRIVAIASNVAFIIYATIDGLTPVLILHVALLPLNVLRLLQLRDFIRQVELAAREGFSIEALVPLMKRQILRANETLFAANDVANELYYVADGTLFLPELQHEVGPGSFLGEFALFSDTGRRTASAIARTDCVLMVLTRTAVFSALLQHPRLGIHLLKLITARLLHNAGRDQNLPGPPIDLPAKVPPKPTGLFATRSRRNAVRVTAVAFVLVAIGISQPLYAVLNRDAVVTTWVNVVSAPISGTVKDFSARPGLRLAETRDVARIVNDSVDRSGVIHATGVAQRAESRLEVLKAYDARINALSAEWRERKTRYADGFRIDLDLTIQELEHRSALLQERVALAETASGRKRTLRLSGNSSQADEDVAMSSQRALQAALTETAKALDRVRQRRALAERGIYLEEDGKEPEWSWRSLDEIRLETVRTARQVAELADEVNTSREILANEQKNLDVASGATLAVPAGMTIWSTTASDGISVTRRERLFTWIDCGHLLLDVPVTETMATLAVQGTRAEVTLEGERDSRKATVVLSRGASSHLTKAELVSLPDWRKTDAQVIVAFDNSAAIADCPIGRRAFVRFPDIGMFQYVRAYLPPLGY